MKKKPAALTIALLALLLLITCLAACTITDAQALDPESTSIPESTSASPAPASSSSTASSRPASSSSSSRPASSSKPVSPSSSSPPASSSSKPAATQAASSSQSSTPVTPAPAPASQSPAPPQPQPQPQPQPVPQPDPPVQNADAGACIAWGNAYADGLNLAVNDGLAIGAAGFENPIETAGKTDAAVQEHLQHQLNGILNMWKSIPEYDPNIKVPCYKLVLSGSQIYVLYG